MTEHYRFDPVRGCGFMVLLASAAAMLMVIGGVAYLIWSSWPR